MIADSSNNRCVDRAVSTIRAALGYETALPDGWIDNRDNRYNKEVIELFEMSFPDREVLVWCQDDHTSHAKYMGDEIESGPEWDKYLFAFTYVVDDEGEKSHMVLGWPRGHPDMTVGLAIAVKI